MFHLFLQSKYEIECASEFLEIVSDQQYVIQNHFPDFLRFLDEICIFNRNQIIYETATILI